MTRRRKISTTISPETYAYLRGWIESGKARTVAEALDLCMDGLRQAEMRDRLERDTAAYFDRLPPEAAAEEQALSSALGSVADKTDFDTF
jgi:hypothetical protein